MNTFRQLSRPRELSLTHALFLAAAGRLLYVRAVLGISRGVAFGLVPVTLAVRRVCPYPPVR